MCVMRLVFYCVGGYVGDDLMVGKKCENDWWDCQEYVCGYDYILFDVEFGYVIYN